MGKLLRFFDEQLLKWGVAFAVAFTVLYPKLPSIGITHTWVYIRLEDFVIVVLAGIWFIQLLRRKIKLPFPLASPIVAYWIAGLLSLVFCLLFIGPHLANFFPSVAVLSYIRRIEYMILFFVAASTVRTEKDIWDYIKILFITVTAVILYGYGQRWYILLWDKFPTFFEKYSFCFPSFQTGNEEFAKGIPLCLPSDARITSTFGGHYDLAGYLVLVLPVLFGVFFATKNVLAKTYAIIISIASIVLLIFTSSRISFVAYLVGISVMLIFIKQKKYILPVIMVSIVLLLSFSSGTAKRFLETIRITNVVTNNQGQIVGVAETNLAPSLQKKISKNPIIVEAPPPSQNLPQGSSFIALPQLGGQPAQKTNVAVVQASVSEDKLKQLKLTNGGVQISTVTGTFLVKQALVYDISFTTRFQGEWPTAWGAFMRNPLLGSGYSSISLATDSDYFRTLGETGLLGFVTFAAVFMYFGILLKSTESDIQETPGLKYLAYGLAGGVIGLVVNASFIDIFEASKIAEPLWLLTGIAAGGILVYAKGRKIDYLAGLKSIYTSAPLILLYLAILVGILFFGTLNNFFVGDDFSWLRAAATSSIEDFKQYFINVHGGFYGPLDRFVIFILYSLSAFLPVGYHLTMILFHLAIGFAVYLILYALFKKKSVAFFGTILFLILPAHGENLYWISAIPSTLSTLFISYGVLFWIFFRKNKSFIGYALSILLCIGALLSYEMAIIMPLLLLLIDFFFFQPKKKFSYFLWYIPFILLLPGYLLVRYEAKAMGLTSIYSFSIIHAIQNFFGNLLGYIGIFFAGEYILPFYNSLRTSLRPHATLVLLPLLALIALIVFLMWLLRKKIVNTGKNEFGRMIYFGIAFTIVALIPFIFLGMIAERYMYLASIGMIIVAIGIVQAVYTQIKNNIVYILLVLIIGGVFAFYAVDVKNESFQWQKAGNISQNLLEILQTSYATARPNAALYLYFVNPPQKYQNAYIFSNIGLIDSAWFIYRDAKYKIFITKTVKEAKANRDLYWIHPAQDIESHIFTFNRNGELLEVQ